MLAKRLTHELVPSAHAPIKLFDIAVSKVAVGVHWDTVTATPIRKGRGGGERSELHAAQSVPGVYVCRACRIRQEYDLKELGTDRTRDVCSNVVSRPCHS